MQAFLLVDRTLYQDNCHKAIHSQYYMHSKIEIFQVVMQL